MIPHPLRITLFFFLWAPSLQAQKPTPALWTAPPAESDGIRSTCNDAGTVNVTLAGGAQSQDPVFLCFDDSLVITHNGDQDLSGDPDPSTVPGIGYGFYQCPPTVPGMTLSDILGDACILNTPPSPTGIWITSGPNPNGNAVFHNDGYLQRFFNNGGPVQVWFAPMTIDHFFGNTYEEAIPGGGAGPCVAVNTAEAFPVVYLNRVEVTGLVTSPYGISPGTGSFVITGGKPEFDGSFYNINIYQRTNPMVLGTITSPPATHGNTVTFTVPNDREYVVEIEDGTGCSTTFLVTSPSLVVEIDCIEIEEGATGCVQATVQNYTSVEALQLFFHYDPAVITFNSVTSPALATWSPVSGASVNGDSILTISHSIFPGETIPPGNVIFTICFTAVGQVGDCSPIILKNRFDGAKNEAIIGIGGGNDAQVAISALNGCVCIVEEGEVKVDITPTPLTCAGSNDGSIQVQVNGGTPPYNYSWAHATNPGYQGTGILAFNPSTFTIPNLIPGIYSITITDSEGVPNVVTRQVLLESPAPIDIQFDVAHPSCFGVMDAAILATVQGGTGALDFAWSNGQGGPGVDGIDNLDAGNYGLTVTDANGCTAEASVSVATALLVVDIVNQQNVTCSGGINSGMIEVEATGGTINQGSAYQYNWNVPGTGSVLSGIPAGNYAVTVTDDNGCTATVSITITAPASPVIDTFIITPAGCIDKPNGAIEVQVTPAPGGATLTYAWTGPNGTVFSGSQISGLATGNYFLTVTDNNGCAAAGIAFVEVVFPFAVVDTFVTTPSCPGTPDGSLGLQVVGGTAPYTFTWSNIGVPGPNSVNAAIPAGSYQVTVTDAEGCGPEVLDLVLVDPARMVVTFSGLDSVSCHQGICDGGATASAAYSDGSSGLFTYSWGSGEIDIQVPSSTAQQLCGGMQPVTVSDANCVMDTFVLIPSPAPIIVVPDVVNVSCFGMTDGTISVTVSGGIPGYQYVWAPGDTTLTDMRSGLSPGFYQVSVLDQNGCLGTTTLVELEEPAPFVLAMDPDLTRDVRCAGEANGVIGISPAGGNAGQISYQWSLPGLSGQVASGLTEGSYSVTATDSRGCTASLSHSLVAPPPINAVLAPVDEPLCFGESTQVSVSLASGGNGGPFTFSVDNGTPMMLGASVAAFAGSDILVSVFDAQGCRRDTLINIDQPDPLYLDLGSDVDIELGDSTFLGPVNNLGGFTIISYLWNPTGGLDCSTCAQTTASPQRTTTYTLRIEDVNGCAAEDEVTVNVQTFRRVYVPSAFSPNFDGFNDVFTVHVGKGVDQVLSLDIYDRWGNHIHAREIPVIPSDGTILAWDGHYRGRMMDPGTYVYAVRVRFIDGQELIYRGDVQIVR